jgi:hypothetical protein
LLGWAAEGGCPYVCLAIAAAFGTGLWGVSFGGYGAIKPRI